MLFYYPEPRTTSSHEYKADAELWVTGVKLDHCTSGIHPLINVALMFLFLGVAIRSSWMKMTEPLAWRQRPCKFPFSHTEFGWTNMFHASWQSYLDLCGPELLRFHLKKNLIISTQSNYANSVSHVCVFRLPLRKRKRLLWKSTLMHRPSSK